MTISISMTFGEMGSDKEQIIYIITHNIVWPSYVTVLKLQGFNYKSAHPHSPKTQISLVYIS